MRIALIPARSNSSRLKNKNRVPLAGVPLIEYVLRSATDSMKFDHIIVNSDDTSYREFADYYEVGFQLRDSRLAQEDSSIIEVMLDCVERLGILDGWIYLFQPTNPFVSKPHICELIALEESGLYSLVQNVAQVPHNYHAWNQRVITEHGSIEFLFHNERIAGYQAQKKPILYKFGNLLGVSIRSLLATRTLWDGQSGFVVINAPYDLDIDVAEDLRMAEVLLNEGMIILE